jgi:hypothetical protein
MRTFVDMAKSPEEVKEQTTIASPIEPKVPVYPYGLCISLTQDDLDKLDLDPDCEVGDIVHLMAMAKVTSRSENEMETADGKKEKCCRIELQITHLSVEDEDDEDPQAQADKRRGRFYGDDEEGEDAA